MKESLQLTTYMATNAYAEFEDTFAEKHYFKALGRLQLRAAGLQVDLL